MSDNTHTQPDQYGYDQATTDAAAASQVKLLNSLRDQARLLTKAQERVKTHRAKLDRMVAQVASAKPEREDWYAYPGLLHREALQEAAGLSNVALHRVMERNRQAFARSVQGLPVTSRAYAKARIRLGAPGRTLRTDPGKAPEERSKGHFIPTEPSSTGGAPVYP